MISIALAALVGMPSITYGTGQICRDMKGLFTPCPRDRDRTIIPSPVDHANIAAMPARKMAYDRAHPDKRRKAGMADIGKLCHDSKGLFKPC